MTTKNALIDGLWCVVMAGGAGTRFWPASTEDVPKQLLTLVGTRSLLQLAIDRARAVVPAERVLVVTSQRLHAAVVAQLPELPLDNIVAEPERKDTAAAVALATLIVEARGGARVAILTSDHLIGPVDTFANAVRTATAAAHDEAGAIVTFGVVPTYPATGYGYLEVARVVGDEADMIGGEVSPPTPQETRLDDKPQSGFLFEARPVVRFVEKPPLAVATEYVASGRFLWNSGMFVFEVSSMRAALLTHLPEHMRLLEPAARGEVPLAVAFAGLARASIDKGVMEKHHTVRCVPARFAWSDVGSFPALAEHLPNDDAGNASRGVLRTLDAHNNVVWCEDDSEEVAVIGLSDVVVVRAGKRTLVVPKDRAEDIKKLVERG
jgi:mannose-1-phosphate guanylyltransferase